ncbi:MAG: hypothetical protein B9S34_15950 [Opitutia bacterium Tous-C1TDCM]|nr:MAG: hypothetical protein B9S34_15950 [Opitutae bacterium Tous-C1TDCM]
MNAPVTAESGPSFKIGDIYYILFRHKWKILLCTLAGLIAAGVVYKTMKPPFRSVAKLFVRFVITEGKSVGPNQGDASAKSPDQRGETIMTGEKEIILSADLAFKVAETVGSEKILAKAGGGKELAKAIGLVRNGLSVSVPARSSVMHVSLEHPDAEVVQPILREVVERYLKLHVETHRSTGMSLDTLVQETDQLRSRLAQTETDLRKARLEAGVVSLDATKQAYIDHLNRIRDQIFSAQAELAAQIAILDEINKRNPDKPKLVVPKLDNPTPLPPGKLDEYKVALQRLASLQLAEQNLLVQFKPESPRVQEVRVQIEKAEAAKSALLTAHPELIQTSAPPPPAAIASITPNLTPDLNPVTVITQIAALQARIKALNSQIDVVRADAAKVDQLEGTITALVRKKELDEGNFRYYAAALEQARINETLGNGKVSNIGVIQSPSAPFPDYTKIYKIVGGLAAGGLLLGLAWAVALELLFDHSIRRAENLEQQLQAPLFLEIPHLRRRKRSWRELLRFGRKAGKNAAIEPRQFLDRGLAEESRIFHETLRDRLIAYFEAKGLTHKPKLVAVTSVSAGAGVTSIANGLARSLSETGDGHVLLVDLTTGNATSQHFADGRPRCELDELMTSRESARVDDNLYVVTEGKNNDELSRHLPLRFSKIVPKLKASDFDYIIFDLPQVSQVSITPRLSNFMDMTMLVVESEETNLDIAKRAAALLRSTKSNLGIVLNKTKNHVPSRLHQELLVSA